MKRLHVLLLGNGWIPTFFSGLSNLFAFGGISYLYLLPPHLKDQKGYSKIAFTSIGNVWVREHYLSGKLDGTVVMMVDANYK